MGYTDENEHRITIGAGPRSRAISIAAVACAVVLAGVDFVVLRGETVGRFTTDLDEEAATTVELTRVGETHTVQIDARRRVRGETEGRSVDYKIVGPNGTVIADESELVSRKTRYVRFTPYVAGEYAITVSDDRSLRDGRFRGRTATVTVLANDRRILPRILPF